MAATRRYLLPLSEGVAAIGPVLGGSASSAGGGSSDPRDDLRQFIAGIVRNEVDPVQRAIAATNPHLAELMKPLPVRETLAEFLESASLRKSQIALHTDVPRLLAFFEHARVVDVRNVTPETVSRYLAKMANDREWHPTTFNRHREQIHAFFEWLVDLGKLATNPVRRVGRAPISAAKIVALSVPELEALFRITDKDSAIGPVVRVLACTGLRLSEALWLEWSDVDLERRRIYVRAKRDGSWQPKTRTNRGVPIQERLWPTIEAAYAEHRAREIESTGMQPQWVFPSPFGNRWDAANLRKRFTKLARPAGLRWKLADLRHTFATLLAQKGVSLAQVAALLGNSPEICRRHYAYIAPENLVREVEF